MKDRTFTVLFCIVAAGHVMFWVGVILIAWHFLSKWW
jgi:hypothetical protein